MTRRTSTIPAHYFDALYRADPDPWQFRTSAYERDKYSATLAALPHERCGNALEIGCANGVFTRRLASRCDHLLALDASAVALDLARRACADLEHVDFTHASVPRDFPSGTFDLVVLSEVLYYLTPADVRSVGQHCAHVLQSGDAVVLCHWLGETDYPLTGSDAVDLFVDEMAGQGFTNLVLHDEIYRLNRLVRSQRPV